MTSPRIDCEICGEVKELNSPIQCTSCADPNHLNERIDFSKCPACGCKHLYRKKDFNQAVGCMIILIGAILVPWTYGISLLILSLVDYLLYRRIKDSVECYKCKSEFKDVTAPEEIEPFDHHIAELYESP